MRCHSVREKIDAEPSLIFISPRFSMTKERKGVIPNLALNQVQGLNESRIRVFDFGIPK